MKLMHFIKNPSNVYWIILISTVSLFLLSTFTSSKANNEEIAKLYNANNDNKDNKLYNGSITPEYLESLYNAKKKEDEISNEIAYKIAVQKVHNTQSFLFCISLIVLSILYYFLISEDEKKNKIPQKGKELNLLKEEEGYTLLVEEEID